MQNPQAWHEWRRKGICASDAPALMGVSPWKNSVQVWKEKVYGETTAQDTRATTHGKNSEEPARLRFEALMDVVLFGDYQIVHPEVDYFRATLDGIDEQKKIMVEIKCPLNKEDHILAHKGKIPIKYYPQLQHQMLVTDLPGMYYYSYQSQEGVVVEVPRDDAYLKQMVARHHEFWEYVKLRIEAPRYYADHQNLEEDKLWIHAQQKWKDLLAYKEELKQKEKNLRTEIQRLANFKNAQGFGLKLTQSTCKGDIDYDQAIEDYKNEIKAMNPNIELPELDKEKYRKKSFEKWTIRLC